MNRRRRLLLAALGVAFVAVGVAVGFDRQPTWAWTAGVSVGVLAFTVVAIAVAGRKLRNSPDEGDDEPTVSWADDDSFAEPAPERSDRSPPLSSEEFASVVERAGTRARNHGTVAAGLTVVRSPLREALSEALVAGGRSEEAAEAAIEDGSWTDDRLAASVLEPSIRPPDRPLRERLRAWLFPERVVRERSRRAMNAVAEAADEALPTVPGQSAPRTKPVLRPRLEELERGADGELQRAVDPTATARGPRPPRPTLATDDGETEDGTIAGRGDRDSSGTADPGDKADRREVTER